MTDAENKTYVSQIKFPGDNTYYHVRDTEARAAIGDLETDKHDLITEQNPLDAALVSGIEDVATSGDYEDLDDLPVVDDLMDGESTNAVQNKVIKEYIDDAVEDLGDYIRFKGTKTAISGGASGEDQIKAIADAKCGDVWRNADDDSEWICKRDLSAADATAWDQLGPDYDLTIYELRENLGDLAFEDTAVGTMTPQGAISTIEADAVAATIAAMTDTSKIYKYTGNETGMVTNNFYEYDGSAWVSLGGVNYTPAGSISAGTLSVTPETTTIYSLDDVGEVPSHAADSFTAPQYTQGTYTEGEACSWSATITNEVLEFSWTPNTPGSHASDTFVPSSYTQGEFDQGELPERSQVTVVTGIQSAGYSVDPAWTGTAVDLEFTGTPDTLTVGAPA